VFAATSFNCRPAGDWSSNSRTRRTFPITPTGADFDFLVRIASAFDWRLPLHVIQRDFQRHDSGKNLLAIVFVVCPAEIRVVHDPDGHDGEGKDFGSRLEMAGNDPVWRRQSHVRMQLSIDDITIHAHQVSWLRRVLYEGILRGKSAV